MWNCFLNDLKQIMWHFGEENRERSVAVLKWAWRSVTGSSIHARLSWTECGSVTWVWPLPPLLTAPWTHVKNALPEKMHQSEQQKLHRSADRGKFPFCGCQITVQDICATLGRHPYWMLQLQTQDKAWRPEFSFVISLLSLKHILNTAIDTWCLEIQLSLQKKKKRSVKQFLR